MTAAYETNSETKSRARNLTRSVVLATLIFTSLSVGAASVNATTTAKSFAFGPGTAKPTSGQDTATLSVPARTNVKVTGILNPVSGLPATVLVQVIPAGSTTPIASLTLITPVSPLPGLPFLFPVETVTGFSSQVGCPSPWTIRVKTTNGNVPGVGVSGGITLDYQKPDTVNLDMVGDTISIERNDFRTRNLSGHGSLGIANNSLIAGTGEFRIRAKWDAPFGSPFEDGYALKVRLLKPDGSEADTETGRPQNYNGDKQRVDFWYTVTAADTLLTGPWRLRIFNTVGPNSQSRKVYNFDIENFAFPGFNSTFKAECN